LSSSQILAGTPSKLFALEPEAVSWEGLGGGAARPEAGGTKLLQRARLLRAEGRHGEALRALHELRERLPPGGRRQDVEKDIVATVRNAAETTGKASFITELLNGPVEILKDRRDVISFRLLEAKLLLDDAARDAGLPVPESAIQTYLEISKTDGVM